MRIKNKKTQTKLEINKEGMITVSKKLEKKDDLPPDVLAELNNSRFKRKFVLFRNSVSEIPSTTYGAFALYNYPAKFIPQVIAYVIKKYSSPESIIFDPFAGYGTVGAVSRVYGNDYELWDLNPLTDTFHNAIICKDITFNLPNFINELKKSNEEFTPQWNNLNYWFPEEFLPLLMKSWGFVHSLPKEDQNKVIIPLIKVTRYFSWGDEKTHKLNRSKHAKKKIEGLLKSDWKTKFYTMLKKEISSLLNRLSEYKKLKPKDVTYKINFGIDALETRLKEDVNILISSPPYLQAQEYIRSTKLALYWLGYDDKKIRELGRKEIPYRKVEKMNIHSELFHNCREKIETEKLTNLYDRYFHSILKIYTNLSQNVTDYMCIFIGPASIRATPVPIDDIVIEHLQEFGWKHDITYIDRIVGHSMFKAKFNPATGLKNKRISTEHLAILKKG